MNDDDDGTLRLVRTHPDAAGFFVQSDGSVMMAASGAGLTLKMTPAELRQAAAALLEVADAHEAAATDAERTLADVVAAGSA